MGVWHKSLLSKLPSYGFSPALTSLIHSYLSDRSIAVVVDGSVSLPCSINSGVPQGCVLSPTLFLLFINDLLSATNSPIHSYADDSTLHCSTEFSRNPPANRRATSRMDSISQLEVDLTRISDWGSSNLVKFNSIKTQFQIISLSTFSQNFNINFNDSTIANSNSLNILGLNINSKLSWKPHINQLAKAASQKLGILYRCRPFFTCEQLPRIYKGLIRPCLEYCSHVWGGSSSTYLLDRVESKAFRLINAPHLTSQLPSLKLRRGVASLSLSFTGTILVGAWRSLTIVFLVPKAGDAILGLQLPHMNIVWRCATRASIDMVPASFLSQLICGTLYLLLPFHPLTIYLLSKVRCIGTSEKLIINNIFFIPF